ncbi:Selenoprotein [Sulfitobacter guttiformis KCTC 32187]|nr:Selenoprotein [Sulfitobacter guttiformis KCTC 32187]
MNDARYLLVPHPIQDATDDEMRTKAQEAFGDVLKALTQNDT